MKRHFIVAVILVSGILMFTGCFPTGEKEKNLSGAVDFSAKKIFELNKDNITAEFALPEISNDLPLKIKLKKKTFDVEKMLDIFFTGKIIIDEKTWEGNYYANDRSFLYAEENSLSFCDGKTADRKNFQIDAPVNYQAAVSVSKEYYKELFGIADELRDFSRQKAIDDALELISALKITNLGEPDVYAFSLNTYSNLNKSDKMGFAFNENYPLTEENEVYVLRFPQVFENIELADLHAEVKDGDSGSVTVFSPYVTVGVSQDGIFYFEANEVYEAEYETVSNGAVEYDANYSLNDLVGYLDDVYFKEKTVLNKMKAVYTPTKMTEDGNVEYSLAWSFEGYRRKGEESCFLDSYKIVYSAETGIRTEYRQ